jgi:electron transfer flavoprotein beta subunit
VQNTVACYKWVADEADIRVHPDLSVDLSRAAGRISEYDKHAIELAVQLAGNSGGQAVGLTFGAEPVRKSLKDALSRGLDEALWIKAPEQATVDAVVTARALAAGVKSLDGVGVIVCAEGSGDSYARQTAPRLAALLGLPVVTSVCEATFVDGVLRATRRLEDSLETVAVALPVVVAVLPQINRPAIPGLKAVMAAGRKPVTEKTAEELGVDLAPKSEITSMKGFAQARKNVLVESVADLVAALKKEGIV